MPPSPTTIESYRCAAITRLPHACYQTDAVVRTWGHSRQAVYGKSTKGTGTRTYLQPLSWLFISPAALTPGAAPPGSVSAGCPVLRQAAGQPPGERLIEPDRVERR